MAGLLEAIQAAFSRELVSHIAARLGESEGGIAKGLSGIVPVVLGGLVNKAASCETDFVFAFSVRAHELANGTLSSVTAILGVMGAGTASGSGLGQGKYLLGTLFGATAAEIAAPVSAYAGIRQESALVLWHLVGAVLPAMMGQYAAHHQLNALGFTATLLSLKKQTRALLPAGLSSFTALLWLGGLGTMAAQPALTAGELSAAHGMPAPSGFSLPRLGKAVALLLGLVWMCYTYGHNWLTTSGAAAWQEDIGELPLESRSVRTISLGEWLAAAQE